MAVSLIDRLYMAEAEKEARRALKAGERPVGAVVIHQRRLLGRSHHQTRALRDPTAHAAMIALTQAAEALAPRQLKAARMYVTARPCAMCRGALAQAGVERVVYGAGPVADPSPRPAAMARMRVIHE